MCENETPNTRIADTTRSNLYEQHDHLVCTSLSAIKYKQRRDTIDAARTCIQLLLGAGADPTVSELKRTDMSLSQPLEEDPRDGRSPLDTWWSLWGRPFEVGVHESNVTFIVDH